MRIKQASLLTGLMNGLSVPEAAKQAGIAKQTAYSYLKDPEFAEELRQLQTEAISAATRYMQTKLTECARELVKIIEKPDVSDQVRINAINCLFTNCRAFTESTQFMDMAADLEKRLSEVENRQV